MADNSGAAGIGNVREAEARANVVARADTFVEQEVYAELQRRLAVWAADDSAEFPTVDHVRAQLRRELETLCRGLGRWSFVTPSEVFVGDEFGWFG